MLNKKPNLNSRDHIKSSNRIPVSSHFVTHYKTQCFFCAVWCLRCFCLLFGCSLFLSIRSTRSVPVSVKKYLLLVSFRVISFFFWIILRLTMGMYTCVQKKFKVISLMSRKNFMLLLVLWYVSSKLYSFFPSRE